MEQKTDTKRKAQYDDLCLFISECSTKSKSLKNYTDFKRINECLSITFPQVSDINILDFTDPKEFVDVVNKLNGNNLYKDYNKRGNNQYSNTVSVYQDFLWAKKFAGLFTSLDTAPNKNFVNSYNLPLQQIFYGAPGTGKSHEIKELTFGKSVVRTTFHPDSDYSTFVGAYKPTSREMPVTTVIGTKSVPVDDTKGVAVTETKIVYEFVPQAFLQAYSKAWQLMAETEESGQAQPQFLIIEEINRGNCAQIFGDLFQLIDRNDNGFSEYPINADKDIENYLKKYFNECNLEVDSSINSEFDGYDGDIAADIRNGKVLVLPPNLCIWATMNTSDQSLFPIDSAFKRRWDWKYIPINTNIEQWTIDVNDVHYSWSSFLNKINTEIGDTTSSEDKKLGFYFCKAKDKVISAEKFVSKVLFYIYNDVFKDYGFDKEFFKDNENGNKTNAFQDFFNPNGTINELNVKKFLDNLGVITVNANFIENTEEDNEVLLDEDGNSSNSTTKDMSRYTVNGSGNYGKCAVPKRCFEIYIQNNPTMTSQELVDNWLAIGINGRYIVETESGHNIRAAKTKDKTFTQKSYDLSMLNGEKIYVSNQYNLIVINDFIKKVNAQPWGIKIEKIN